MDQSLRYIRDGITLAPRHESWRARRALLARLGRRRKDDEIFSKRHTFRTSKIVSRPLLRP